MVLQSDQPLPVWGKSQPGSEVEVQFAGQSATTVTSEQGLWRVQLDPLEPSFNQRDLLVKSGDKVLRFEGVLVGEVWFASGQSNMQWRNKKAKDGDIVALGANDPFLRLYEVENITSELPRFSADAVWRTDGYHAASEFSSVAYQFARDLRKTLQVPVGIINASWGGTPAIAWTREGVFEKHPLLLERYQYWETKLLRYDEDYKEWDAAYTKWMEERGLTNRMPRPHQRQGAPKQPEVPITRTVQRTWQTAWWRLLRLLRSEVPFGIKARLMPEKML